MSNGNVGIRQRMLGEQREQDRRSDHGEDLSSVFACTFDNGTLRQLWARLPVLNSTATHGEQKRA